MFVLPVSFTRGSIDVLLVRESILHYDKDWPGPDYPPFSSTYPVLGVVGESYESVRFRRLSGNLSLSIRSREAVLGNVRPVPMKSKATIIRLKHCSEKCQVCPKGSEILPKKIMFGFRRKCKRTTGAIPILEGEAAEADVCVCDEMSLTECYSNLHGENSS